MTNAQFQYDSIGVIHTPFDSPEEMPIQPVGAEGVVGTVELDPSYAEGLQDLDGFTHCMLLYHFHAASNIVSLQVEPFLDDSNRGLFATRAPQRPNPIGLSVVEIDSVTDHEVSVEGIDVVDGTPLLDVKPFVPQFDVPDAAETGWLDASKSTIQSQRAVERFL